jgi:pilus assembly protein CpaB
MRVILLVLIAVVAGGLAAFLALGNAFNQPAPEQPVVVAQVPHDQVLIAKTDIGMGERLGVSNLEWQDWPQNTVQPGYITSSQTPNAIESMSDTVARFELFKGEPVQQAKLVHSNQGYLSAVLDKGKRGVSISVAAEAASGGFIVPNDHVDVILTRGGPSGQISDVLLSNVRVLAIGTRLGEAGKTGGPDDGNPPPEGEGPKSQIFAGGAIATLELDPVQAETVINATSLGKLSLTLRSIVDFNQASSDDTKLKRNAPIRLIRYGQEASVMAGQAGGDAETPQASVNAANYVPPPAAAPATPIPAPAVPAVGQGSPLSTAQ